jgi:hypothetical protein
VKFDCSEDAIARAYFCIGFYFRLNNNQAWEGIIKVPNSLYTEIINKAVNIFIGHHSVKIGRRDASSFSHKK